MSEEDPLIHELRIVKLVTYFNVGAVTLFLWDYLITLGMEIEFVWPSKWTVMKALYLFQRYMPFIDTVLLGLYHDLATLSPGQCKTLYITIGSLMVFSSAISEIIMTLRAWAVWYRDRRLAIILPILFVIVWAPDFGLLPLFLRSLKFAERPYPDFQGCMVMQADQLLIYVWAIFMIWDAFVLVLMIIPGISAYRTGGNSALMNVIYRDGVVYYFYLFLLSSLNIIVIKALPATYQQLLITVARSIHSMLTSRVVLNIRVFSKATVGWSDGLTDLENRIETHPHQYQDDTDRANGLRRMVFRGN